MARVRVKICGNTRRVDVKHAIRSGADAVGCIVGFPSTPRNLSVDKAESLMKGLPPFVYRVVVAPLGDLDMLRKIGKKLSTDAVQLIGELPYNDELRDIFRGKRLIRVIHAQSGDAVRSSVEASKHYDAVLIDSAVAGVPGGTGHVHDWNLSQRVAKAIYPTPLILAGGLTPSNVYEAATVVRPFAVDVSSGVELTPGVKDHQKVERFIENVEKVRI
jgi:phosphoribosylanthranilate isomerase